jgi:hypothetical protein
MTSCPSSVIIYLQHMPLPSRTSPKVARGQRTSAGSPLLSPVATARTAPWPGDGGPSHPANEHNSCTSGAPPANEHNSHKTR